MESIGQDGSISLARTRPVSEVRNGYTYFEDGDVAFAKVTPCFENGKGALMRNLVGGAGFGTSELTVLRPKPGVNARFLNYIVQSEPFRRLGVGAMSGAGGLKRVPDEFTRDFVVAWPEATVQANVAAFLDGQTARIDALIAEKVRLSRSLEEFRLSAIHEALCVGLDREAPTVDTGDEWFAKVPAHWAFCPLNYRYEVQLGKMLDEKRITGAHLLPYLRNTDVQWDHINADSLPQMDIAPTEMSRYSVRAGDLLVCEGGEVGRAAIWEGPENAIGYQKALHRVRPRDASDVPRFLFYALFDSAKRGRFESRDKATIAHLTAEAFRRYRFTFPPYAEQTAIVQHLDSLTSKIDGLQSHCTEHINRLREYRSSLISAAVTGQLDINAYKEAA